MPIPLCPLVPGVSGESKIDQTAGGGTALCPFFGPLSSSDSSDDADDSSDKSSRSPGPEEEDSDD